MNKAKYRLIKYIILVTALTFIATLVTVGSFLGELSPIVLETILGSSIAGIIATFYSNKNFSNFNKQSENQKDSETNNDNLEAAKKEDSIKDKK